MLIAVAVHCLISTHSRAKAAGGICSRAEQDGFISTHSRAKAAGCENASGLKRFGNFNSQPREGGWFCTCPTRIGMEEFQLTAARRRLDRQTSHHPNHCPFQLTAARRRLGFRSSG